MPDNLVGLVVLLVGLAILLALLANIVHIVREYERLVVFFLGRLQGGGRGPGLVLLIPFVQQPVKVDLRERFLEVPQQTCITKDNAPISIDFLVYSKVFDPEESVTAVTSFSGASQPINPRRRPVRVAMPLAKLLSAWRVARRPRAQPASSRPVAGSARPAPSARSTSWTRRRPAP